MELPHLRRAETRNLRLVARSMLSGRPAIEFEVAEPGQFIALLTYVSNWNNFSWATWTVRSCDLSAVGILKSDVNRSFITGKRSRRL